jgi:hypothetical protein
VSERPPRGKVAAYIKGVRENRQAMVQRYETGRQMLKNKRGEPTGKSKPIYGEHDLSNIDVVHSSWLADCIGKGFGSGLQPLQPRYLLHTSRKTAAQLSKFYDQFGDSYNEDASAEDLRSAMQVVTTRVP